MGTSTVGTNVFEIENKDIRTVVMSSCFSPMFPLNLTGVMFSGNQRGTLGRNGLSLQRLRYESNICPFPELAINLHGSSC